MDGSIVILFICIILTYKITYNHAYKKGICDANDESRKEGYQEGMEQIKKEFHEMIDLPDDELMDRINKIRKEKNES